MIPQRRHLPQSVIALLDDDDGPPADQVHDDEEETEEEEDENEDETSSTSSSSSEETATEAATSQGGGILALDSTSCFTSREQSDVFAPLPPPVATPAAPAASSSNKTTPEGTPLRGGSIRFDPNSNNSSSLSAVRPAGTPTTSFASFANNHHHQGHHHPSSSSHTATATSSSGSGGSPIHVESQHVVTSPKSAAEPGADFPPFRLVRKLGNGGFGAVYHAVVESGQLAGSLVAVKQMPIETDISREERVMCSLPPHPHCVRYLGTRRTANHVYLVMEFVSGGSLRSIRNATGPMAPSVLRRYAYMTLLGLHHLHMHKIIHQDIKGDNVVVNELGNVKIVDFGCAKRIEQTTASLGGGGGTVQWMAPEVLRGSKPSTKSDVWSFGCMLLELTNDTGSPWSFPEHMNTFQAVHAIANATQPPPMPKFMSATARSFVALCLQLDSGKRPTVNTLLQHAYFTAAAAEEELALDEQRLRACSTAVVADVVGSRQSGVIAAGPASSRRKDVSVESVNYGFKLEAVSDDDDDEINGNVVRPSPLHHSGPGNGGLPRSSLIAGETLTSKKSIQSPTQHHSPHLALSSPNAAQQRSPLPRTTASQAPSVWESSGSASVEPSHALYVVQDVDSKFVAKRRASGNRKKLSTATAAQQQQGSQVQAKPASAGVVESILGKFKCFSPS